MDATLVILAAGLGSRFGYENGLKQMQGIGPNLETISEYAAFDAKRAGFNKVVFVITKDMEKPFYEQIVKEIEPHMLCDFAFQDVNDYPKTYSFNRTKPWGTGHALLVAKDAVKEPFMVIHADDFYGADAYKKTYDFLLSTEHEMAYSMVGYYLKNTVSKHGTVNRGLCEVNEHKMLTSVNEARGIHSNEIYFYENEQGKQILSKDQLVSMGCWGFQPSIFTALEKGFVEFLDESDCMEREFYLPAVVNHLIQNELATMKVLSSTDDWYGVTYEEDKDQVVKAISKLIEEGKYPSMLWK